MTRLRLAASDAEDLEILSARLQDAAGKLKDFTWLPKKRRFAAVVRGSVAAVRKRGDTALVELTNKFDRADVTVETL